MRPKRFLTHNDCLAACTRLVKDCGIGGVDDSVTAVYGVPKGGIPVAYLVQAVAGLSCRLVGRPELASLIVDDVVDTGATKKRHLEQTKYPARFAALASYLSPPREKDDWIVFPWEVGPGGTDTSADDIVIRLLEVIGEDPAREGLKETPRRVLAAWKEWSSGYGKDPKEILKCFEDGSEHYDEMVVVKDLPFYSVCEHHLAPFFGTASIAYIPDRRIVGLSKLGRVLDIFARRLQVQERLTTLVADAIQDNLKPKGVGVLIKARHLCMESRGYARQGHHTITSALRGEFLSDAKVRSEFLSLA
jgi:GTP cyclohydrolase I